jgi:hypothetical protein
MIGRTAMVEYWVLGPWKVAKWEYLPSNEADDGEEWFTVHPEDVEFDPDRARCSSLHEALLVVVTKSYIGSGVEDAEEAWALAFAFARQIGMHRWDGEEWVHVHPGEQ